jgi:hypothetical protein
MSFIDLRILRAALKYRAAVVANLIGGNLVTPCCRHRHPVRREK